ncbi:glycosyltransferase [Vibrio sp. SS-MA-C1-2]|uniref:glycosyltransferase n=1 Tax=Vibrio sp. SS-MA-C1-2 TaxID=2908646 RepID=UPI001F3101B5|nr:glycosyltransferase [Vibrio sp. SS-MA-C1-2]UJF17143.1 glycosyltransferase [Vibrio sp. SS-MA-C1-2]
MSKKVTVYITTLNRLDFFKRAVNSVLAQDYPSIEIIVVDDKSDKDVSQAIQEYIADYDNVLYFYNEERMGACYSRNIAINHSTGTYITGLDDDDYFESNRISHFVNKYQQLVDNHTQFAGVFSNFNVIRDETLKGFERKSNVSFEDIKTWNHVGNQLFSEVSKFKKINGFDPNLPAWQDFDVWYRMIKQYGNAINDGSYSYTQDMSHDADRISLNSVRINKAFDIFQEKFSLNKQETDIIRLSLLNYCRPDQSFPISLFIKTLFSCRNGAQFYLTCKIFMKYVLKMNKK